MKARLCLAALLSLCSTALSELQWERKELEFRPAATDTEVRAEFHFTNVGREPVTIESITPGCGCTTATPDKSTYQPGEQGQIAATFTIGQRTGEQHKPIRVKLQGEPAETILMMVTHLPELMKISPQFVFWKAGEMPQPKTIDLTVLPEARLRVTRVLTTDPKMKVTLETVAEGKTYKIAVTPEDTTTPVMAVLSIDTTVSSNIQKIFIAYAQVKSPATNHAAAPVKPAESRSASPTPD